jgi:hypothetical protein
MLSGKMVHNLKSKDAGTYECVLTNIVRLNNTFIDRPVNFIAGLHRRLNCVKVIQYYPACHSYVPESFDLRLWIVKDDEFLSRLLVYLSSFELISRSFPLNNHVDCVKVIQYFPACTENKRVTIKFHCKIVKDDEFLSRLLVYLSSFELISRSFPLNNHVVDLTWNFD